MNKSELITAFAEKQEITKAEAGRMVNGLIELITDTLVEGGEGTKINLVGFGSLEVKKSKGRIGRNPKNPSEEIVIPDSRRVAFKAGKSLKDAVKGVK